MRIIITGGCGFIGSHFVEHFLKETDWDIVVLDKLNYASSGYDRLRDINVFDEKRVKIFNTDLSNSISSGTIKEIGKVDYIINLASESHVDNSIEHPVTFTRNNVDLMLNVLEYAKLVLPKLVVHFSSDEVMGTAPEGVFHTESDAVNPTNPYSASKLAQEGICRAYANTYGVPIIISRTMNVIGERQHPEKFVPLIIKRVLGDRQITIHADEKKEKAGSRFYIHARNVAKAIHFLLDTKERVNKESASSGVFNIVGEKEIDNLELAQFIAKYLKKDLIYEMVDFHGSRPGHDLRYALDGSKLEEMGFYYPKSLEDSLRKTIDWYLQRPEWLK